MPNKKKNSAHINPKAFQKYADRVQELSDQNNGKLTPQMLLSDAKKVTSPLHDYFEWNDTEAAHQYRLWQARYLIGSIEVTVSGGEPVRAYYNLTVKDNGVKQAYFTLEAAMGDESLRKQLLNRALLEAESWQRKYHHLEELAMVFTSIAKTKKKVKL